MVHCSFAQLDTTKYDLPEVIKTASAPSSYQASSPTQILKTGIPEKLNALSVSDAVKHFSGVQVKDYGGVGGLKTVSIRSLGANHTNVIYDGISISDYQSGQTDLGRFSLDNVEMITLNIGESDNIFQTAQAQSLAGSLNIITQTFAPVNKKRNLRASLKGGSFGFINPSLLYSETLNETFSASASADWLKTKGNYPFAQLIGYSGDEKQYKKRENSDVETLKLEANLKGNFKNKGNLLFKNYFFTSERGLPGPAHYHTDIPSYDRLKDRNFFSQIHYDQRMGEKVKFQTNAKFSLAHTGYFNSVRKQTHLYDQREFYLNATFLYPLTGKISFSWANDGSYSDFESNQGNVSPSRTSWLSALSGKYEIQRWNVTAKLLNNHIRDQVKTGHLTTTYNHLSPYLGFSGQPVATFPLRLRGFYKNTFRMPTFGDLYYFTADIRPDLKPEKARQVDIGLTFVSSLGNCIPYFSLSSDVYWNQVDNKIVAVPTNNMFLWSVKNYGRVDIQGVDLNVATQIQCNSHFLWELNAAYTYQNTLNKSTEIPQNYNKRLPYTARHSASGNLTLKTPWIDAGYNIIYCGKRYYRADNDPTSQMSPFAEQGVNLMRTFAWQKTKITLTAECLNIGNVQYDVVNAYPMPARSFRFGIKINY
ncbi:ligand-gated channel [Bacteroidia bacterium]|nr:ligand-gated channel [Bacteroidia bacterium]GHT48527.1 ligand-gated channel [Bacteroidia bacterium]